MAEAQTNTAALERTKELTDRLEAGIQDLLQSDKYMEYLKSMSQFHRYSTRNTLLIHMQNPRATRVASFKLWDEKFNRHVKKGEKSIRIFAPIMTKEKREFDKIDPDTKAPLLDKDGKIIKEELESETLRFKLVPVFDVSQTYGDPLPELVENLTGDVEQYEAFLDTLREVSPLPIEFEPLAENNDGYCRYGEKNGIREGMSEVQTKAPPDADLPAAISPVYRESIPYAREHDELDKYRDDVKLNTECRDAIHDAINESRYDSNFYKMKDAAKRVLDTYGAERVELILAKVVQGADWDGRYSRQNKDWAKGFEIPQSMKDIYSNTHPCLLDGFLDKVREKPSVLETLKANAEKSRSQSEPKQDNKKSKEMEM